MLKTVYNIGVASHKLALTKIAAQLPSYPVHLHWSAHARCRWLGKLSPTQLYPMRAALPGALIEAEIVDGVLEKVVVRYPGSLAEGHEDLVLVLAPPIGNREQAAAWTVVTCWTNHKEDRHETLRLGA